MSHRVMSVAGAFYPNSCAEIERYISKFNSISLSLAPKLTMETKAIIVPHAGYIYSGFTANLVYKKVAKEKF